MLVAFQLRFPVVFSCDDDPVKPDAVSEDEHIGMEPQLPAAVHQRLRHHYLELQVYLAVPFRHVSETRGHEGGVDDIAGYHLAVHIFYGLHYEELVPVVVGHLERVPARLSKAVLRNGCLALRQTQRGRDLTSPEVSDTLRGAAARGKDGGQTQYH